MSHKLDLDTRYEDYRPYPARHRAIEVSPVVPPPWALEPTGQFRLPGESTVQLAPVKPVPELTVMRPPMRAPGAALAAVSMPAARPTSNLLGRCLHALRNWGRS